MSIASFEVEVSAYVERGGLEKEHDDPPRSSYSRGNTEQVYVIFSRLNQKAFLSTFPCLFPIWILSVH